LEYAFTASCVYRVEEDIDEITLFFMSRNYNAMSPAIIDSYIGSLNADYNIDTSEYYSVFQNNAICNLP